MTTTTPTGLDPHTQLTLLEHLVNTDSAPDTSGIDDVYDILEPHLKQIGFSASRVPTSGPDVLRAHLPGSRPSATRVIMLGHVDTVFPTGTAAERPFTINDGRAFGPGVADMKAGLVVMLAAVASLPDHVRAGLELTMLFNGDEESSSTASRPVIEATAAGQDVALVFEAARRNGAIVESRRGVHRYRLDVAGRAAHSGSNPEAGANALETLAHTILGVQAIDRDIDGATVTAVLARGGSRPNIVPDAASVDVDCRFDDAAAEAQVRQRLTGLTGPGPVDGTSVALTSRAGRPPYSAPATDLVTSYVEVAAAHGVTVPTTRAGGGSDGNFTAAMGIATLDGLGAVGGGAHTSDEYIEVPTLAQRSEICAALLTRLGQAI
ncbi:M20 family metallopeptidase [Phytoactinopolyspora limicola]|uniref:M20 family metallopeptidase n=1 Tax=Phytoactinopolyspora limicola TaxID=2715536 RepID=UPI00140E59DA|nr:M20 family metallopeptidase [Phytoactinopolyspora limicola]